MISLALLLAAGSPDSLVGTWAGDRLVATVTEQGMRVESDCAGGRTEGPLRFEGNGRFRASGHFAVGHGGPQRADGAEDAVAANYVGQVTGDRMMLTVEAGHGAVRHYTLIRSAHMKLLRCL